MADPISEAILAELDTPPVRKKPDTDIVGELKRFTGSQSAQVVLSWNGSTLQIEGTALNGARRKIEGVSFTDLPFELRAELIADLASRKAHTREAPKADRIDPQVARDARIAAARAAHDRDYIERYNNATPAERAIMDERREKAQSRARQQSSDLWHSVATNHDVQLANKVITDPKKRPQRRIIRDYSANGFNLLTPAEYAKRIAEPTADSSNTSKKKKLNLKNVIQVEIPL